MLGPSLYQPSQPGPQLGNACSYLAGILVLCELLSLQVLPVELLPVSQPQLHDLDLRMVEYNDATDNEDGAPDLGGDLILEFKSENLSGIVRLNRVEESSSQELSKRPKNKRFRHGKGGTDSKVPYDERGAMYFAVSVVSLYGLSIGVLVAFSLRKDWDEDEVKNFQRSWVKMDHMMEKQEKQRAKKLMTRAIIAIHQPKRGSVCTAVTRETVYMALAPMALVAPVVPCVDRRPSRESIIWNNLPPPMVTIEEGGTDNGAGNQQPLRKSPTTWSRGSGSPGPSGYIPEENNNGAEDEHDEQVDAQEDEQGCGLQVDEERLSPQFIGQRSLKDPDDEEDDGQFLEEYLLEGQLEEDLDLGSETLPISPVAPVYMGLDPGAPGGGGGISGGPLKGSRSHDSPPSLASPEEDLDLDDEVFLESPTTPRWPEDSLGVQQQLSRGYPGVLSPVLLYMDDEESSLSWSEPTAPTLPHSQRP